MRHNYSIWDEMRRMQEQMDSLFDNFFTKDPFMTSDHLLTGPNNPGNDLVTSNYKQPVTDIYETEKEVIAEIEMPGLDKKDIKVHVTETGIEVKAEKNSEVKLDNKKTGSYRFERNYSGFSRYFRLPSSVDSNRATAEYKNGILKIVVPKLKLEEHKKKLIDVK